MHTCKWTTYLLYIALSGTIHPDIWNVVRERTVLSKTVRSNQINMKEALLDLAWIQIIARVTWVSRLCSCDLACSLGSASSYLELHPCTHILLEPVKTVQSHMVTVVQAELPTCVGGAPSWIETTGTIFGQMKPSSASCRKGSTAVSQSSWHSLNS